MHHFLEDNLTFFMKLVSCLQIFSLFIFRSATSGIILETIMSFLMRSTFNYNMSYMANHSHTSEFQVFNTHFNEHFK